MKLAAQVRANEVGNVIYRLCRSRADANTYKVLELYKDKQALDVHQASEHFKAAGAELGRAWLAGQMASS